jgi:hypothetical protein
LFSHSVLLTFLNNSRYTLRPSLVPFFHSFSLPYLALSALSSSSRQDSHCVANVLGKSLSDHEVGRHCSRDRSHDRRGLGGGQLVRGS